jgi:hypothetical protein
MPGIGPLRCSRGPVWFGIQWDPKRSSGFSQEMFSLPPANPLELGCLAAILPKKTGDGTLNGKDFEQWRVDIFGFVPLANTL